MKRKTKFILAAAIVAVMLCALSVTAFAASGDVAGAIQNTWNAAKTQIKQVVNNVVLSDLLQARFKLNHSVEKSVIYIKALM